MKHTIFFALISLFPLATHTMHHAALHKAIKYIPAIIDKATGATGWGIVMIPSFVAEVEQFANRSRREHRLNHSRSLDMIRKQQLLGAHAEEIDLRIHNGPLHIAEIRYNGENTESDYKRSIYSCYEDSQKTIYLESELIDTLRAVPSFEACLKGALEHETTQLTEDHTTRVRLAALTPLVPYYAIKKLGNKLFGKSSTMQPAYRLGRSVGRLSVAGIITEITITQLYAFKRSLICRADEGITPEHIDATISRLRLDNRRVANPLDNMPLPQKRIDLLKKRQQHIANPA